jgi:hypothetical protein
LKQETSKNANVKNNFSHLIFTFLSKQSSLKQIQSELKMYLSTLGIDSYFERIVLLKLDFFLLKALKIIQGQDLF